MYLRKKEDENDGTSFSQNSSHLGRQGALFGPWPVVGDRLWDSTLRALRSSGADWQRHQFAHRLVTPHRLQQLGIDAFQERPQMPIQQRPQFFQPATAPKRLCCSVSCRPTTSAHEFAVCGLLGSGGTSSPHGPVGDAN